MAMSSLLHVAVQLLVLFIPCVEAENPKSTTVVDKVIKMMQDIKEKSKDELFKETLTFTEFDNWCSNTKEEREASIKENEETEAALEAEIKTTTASIEELTGKITESMDDISKDEANIAKLKDDRKIAKAAYDKEAEDLSTAITALKKGIDGLQAAKKPSFLQLRTSAKKPPLALADFLGLKGGAAKALIEKAMQPDDSHLESYNFDLSDGLSETLWGILNNMREAKTTADQEEMKAVNTYMLAIQTEQQTMARHKSTKESQELQKSKNKAAKTTAQKSLKQTQDALSADRTYLQDTETMCAEKKAAWTTRKGTREDEIDALKKAVDIMKGCMETNASYKKTASMTQVDASVEKVFGSRDEMLEAAEKVAERVESSSATAAMPRQVTFLQLATSKKEAPERQNVRRKLMDLLRRKSIELRSPMLLSISRNIDDTALEGVTDKLKDLISDLTAQNEDKLVKCEQDRARLKTELADSKAKVFAENERLAADEAENAKLDRKKKRLNKEITELDAAMKKATEIRDAEAENAKHATQEATQGKAAVEMAKDTLSEFYGSKAGATSAPSSNLSTSVKKDAPGPGFDTGKAYKGSGASGTVLGMLDVILDDFKQTLNETDAAETQAKTEFEKFISESAEDKSDKNKDLEGTESAMAELDLSTTKLETETGLLKTKLEESAVVEQSCDVGAVAEDRIAKREKEMEALKEAIKYLNEVIPDLG